jgi:hypothetical protein
MNYFGENFSPLSSDLCGLCVFAGDNPSFACGSAALGLGGEYSFTVNPAEPLIQVATHGLS